MVSTKPYYPFTPVQFFAALALRWRLLAAIASRSFRAASVLGGPASVRTQGCSGLRVCKRAAGL